MPKPQPEAQAQSESKEQSKVGLSEGKPSPKPTEPAINHTGFTNTLTIFQALPIIYILVTGTSFFLTLFTHYLSTRISIGIVLCCIQITLYIFLSIYWHKTSSIDPTDQVQTLHRSHKAQHLAFPIKKYKFYCRTCETCVGNNAYHCKQCRRCVHLFDHHCRWLNNCIGASNYVEFLVLIVGFFVEEGFRVGVSVYLLVCYIRRVSEEEMKIQWIGVWNAVVIFISLIPFFAISALCFLHLYLLFTKKSTIQLILESRKCNRIHPSISKKNTSETVNKNSRGEDSLENDNDGKTPNQFIRTNVEDYNKDSVEEGLVMRKLPTLIFNKYSRPGPEKIVRGLSTVREERKLTIKQIVTVTQN